MRRSRSSPVVSHSYPTVSQGVRSGLVLRADDTDLPLVEECVFGVVLEFGLGFELWEWECEEEVLESFFPEVPEFRFSLWVSSRCNPMDVICLPEP